MGTSVATGRVHRLHPAPFRGGRELNAACHANPEVLNEPGQPPLAMVAEALTLPGLGPLGTLAIDHHGRPCVLVAAVAHDAVSTLVGRVVTAAAALSTCSPTDLDHLTGGQLARALQDGDVAARRRCFDDALRSGQVRFILVLDKVGPRHLDPLLYLARHTEFLLRVLELQRFTNGDGENVLVPRIHLDEQPPIAPLGLSDATPCGDSENDTTLEENPATVNSTTVAMPDPTLLDAPLFHGLVGPSVCRPTVTPDADTEPPPPPASATTPGTPPLSPSQRSEFSGASTAPVASPAHPTHAALEVLERELPPKLSILDASDTICLGHEGWPRHLHYALAHDRETARLAIQLENDFVRPLANLLMAMTEELSELFPEAKVAWDPTWSKNRGRLAITCATHDPTHVARNMTRLIAASAPRIDAALQSLRNPN